MNKLRYVYALFLLTRLSWLRFCASVAEYGPKCSTKCTDALFSAEFCLWSRLHCSVLSQFWLTLGWPQCLIKNCHKVGKKRWFGQKWRQILWETTFSINSPLHIVTDQIVNLSEMWNTTIFCTMLEFIGGVYFVNKIMNQKRYKQIDF